MVGKRRAGEGREEGGEGRTGEEKSEKEKEKKRKKRKQPGFPKLTQLGSVFEQQSSRVLFSV